MNGGDCPDLTDTHCLNGLFQRHTDWFGTPFPLSPGTLKFALKLDELNARQQNRYAFARKDKTIGWSEQVHLSMGLFEKEFQFHVGQMTQLVVNLAGELDCPQVS